MTEATLSSPSQLLSRRALGQLLRDRQTLLLSLLCMVPVMLISAWTLLSLNALRAQWAEGADLPAAALARLDGVVRELTLVGIAAVAGTFIGAYLIATVWRRRSQSLENERLQRILDFVYEMDSGNLATRLDPAADTHAAHVRLVESLNVMTDGFRRMISEVKHATQGLSDAADQILNATNRQIDAATQQDAVVSQTTATVNEVRATVTETAERAQAVAENAQTSIEVSRTGEQAVADAIEGMHLIRRKVEDIADNILILSEHTQQIGEIIATVNSIADQSKMLALNASVEAARAGEEGKGFAVVAMEVRSLAEQSRDATAQVRDILSEIQRATNAAVMVTEEGTKGVDRGVSLVDRAGKTIKELAATIEENAVAAVQIAASTRQQAVGMDQLTSAMRTIKDATAEAASSTMQVERNVQRLQGVAEHLGATLARYRL